MSSDSAESEYEIYRARVGRVSMPFSDHEDAQEFAEVVLNRMYRGRGYHLDWAFSDDYDVMVGRLASGWAVATVKREHLNHDVETALKRHKKREKTRHE